MTELSFWEKVQSSDMGKYLKIQFHRAAVKLTNKQTTQQQTTPDIVSNNK